MHQALNVDVVVLGGGCAGAATALSLLGRDPSLRVAIVEASDYRKPRVGEVLSPQVRPLLKHLGVWDAFCADGHAAAYGTSAVWGDDEPHDNEFIYHLHGEGWHLDRVRFDAMLAREAKERGCGLYTRSRLVAATRQHGGWHLEVRGDEGRFSLDARFVIDATGRQASFARRQGVGKILFDQLLGVFAFFEPVPSSRGHSSRGQCAARKGYTLIEASREGWWYTAPLPDGRLAVGFLSDADRIRALDLRQWQAFWPELEATRTIRRWLGAAQPMGDLSCHAAHTQRLEQVAGRGWLAVGDAATTFDPLSSHGMFKGLRFGILAGYAVSDHLRGVEGALDKYQARVWSDFESYLETRRDYYRQEQRWAEAPFWQRRFGHVTLDPRERLCTASEPPRRVEHLAASEIERLRTLCQAPRAAHDVVAAFQRQRPSPPLSDERIVLALQHLLARGVLTAEATVSTSHHNV